jgi:predicted dehydrogenase
MEQRKLRIALVGCGQIADAHLQEIRKVAAATPVAVCDRHIDLARQAAARFDVPDVFDDLGRMLAETKPDVLHVTTPPRSHRPIALQALAAGVHVYIEKPFTVDAAEADEVLDAALTAGRLVCVGHDQLFDPAWVRCRRLVDAGQLGRIVHIDSIQGYDMSGPFGRAFAEDPDHWLRHLPGGLFQNVMSHALYRITDFLTDERPRVWATWYGEETGGGLPTELRVLLTGNDTTGSLVFSSAARPIQRVTRFHGTKSGFEVDLDARVLRHFAKPKLPGAFAKIEAPIRHLGEAARSATTNMMRFLRSDLHYFAGMNALFQAFYRSIVDGTEPPIPYREIRRVTGLMDEIFASCRDGNAARGQTEKMREPSQNGAAEMIPGVHS